MGRPELLMVLASAVLHASWSAAIKGSRHPAAFNLLQSAVAVAGALLLLPAWHPREVPGAVWGWVAATGVAHGLYFYFLTRAYESGDLSLVYPIVRSTPALLPLLAVPLLGESVSVPGALGIAVVVAGMWLVQTDGDLRVRALLAPGTRFAYLALAATVAYSLIDKQAMLSLAGASWSGAVPRSVAYFSLLSAACSLVFAPLALRRTALADVLAALRAEGYRAVLAQLASLISYGLILEAFRTAPASYVVAVRQTSVLFALGIGVLWLRERPSRARALGAATTVAGVALIAGS